MHPKFSEPELHFKDKKQFLYNQERVTVVVECFSKRDDYAKKRDHFHRPPFLKIKVLYSNSFRT